MELSRRSVGRVLAATTAFGAGGTFTYGQLVGSGTSGEPTALVAGSLLGVASGIRGASVEAHGSAAVRRLVLDGLREPDAVALADPQLFEGVAARGTLFATNALVIAYDPASAHAAALERDWRSAVTAAGVAIGRTNPDVDPLGYRTVMGLELAERADGVDAGAVLDASTVFPETDLLNALEAGKLDAAFAYRSMAAERGLPYVSLPARIDFSSPDHADAYAAVSYDLPDATVRGAPIRYAAAATTPRGEPWVKALVAATEDLRERGFVVPAGYPATDVRLDRRDPATSR